LELEDFTCTSHFIGYAAKLATQPHHPSHGAAWAAFKPTLRNRYKLNITASRPVAERFIKLLQLLNIRLPQTIPYSLSNFTMGNNPSDLRSPTRQTRERRNICLHVPPVFRRSLSAYPDYTAVYTDGSLVQDSTGSAFICNDQVFSYRLHSFNSVFTAKLHAMYQALLFIRRQTQQYHLVCTDSLSGLQNLSAYSPDHPIVIELLIQLFHLHRAGKSVLFCWIPGQWPTRQRGP
jgi:hypothetical protein